jgi:hypothetical protein
MLRSDIANTHYRIRRIPYENHTNHNDAKIYKLTYELMKKWNPYDNWWESMEFKFCDVYQKF